MSEEPEIETTRPNGGLLMCVRGSSQAYLCAGPDGVVDVERVR